MFPTAQLGIGECGTVVQARKAAYLTRYYSMRIDNPRYIGGYFWWYFSEDMVPPGAKGTRRGMGPPVPLRCCRKSD
jgi:hypothetical protein